MKSILKLFIYIIVFILSIIVFLPKESLYNALEKELSNHQVIISNELRSEELFSLKLSGADIYYQGINISNVNKTNITSYLFYTKVDIKNVRLLESISTLLPSPIDNVSITHSILKYDVIDIEAEGKFGTLFGHVDIINRVLVLYIDASSKMKNSYSKILRNMKLKDGRYVYEYKF